uniref:CCHC-type domain-containing protein n=1 Tax=Ananas comosus var. bracteatus TaxID=296719 RepID=A0A6V7PH46_ANACO|nr:unnamed protein product [Ananas comosus var. bracteatus]
MKEDFRKLRQENRSVREYEREFTHLVNCVPGMSWIELFGWSAAMRLRVRNASRLIENEKEKGKKRTTSGAGGQSSSTRLPRYPRPQQRYQGPPGCVICGGNHQAVACSQKDGKCFKYGQPGHISRDCPRGASSAQPTASVQSPARQRAGSPPAMSAGHTFVPRQYEPPRPAPSGRVFAAKVEDPAVVDDVVAAAAAACASSSSSNLNSSSKLQQQLAQQQQQHTPAAAAAPSAAAAAAGSNSSSIS